MDTVETDAGRMPQHPWAGGEIGRRTGLKIPRPKGREGSIPSPPTTPFYTIPFYVLRPIRQN